jgi:superfamily II DNA/RNA helicase
LYGCLEGRPHIPQGRRKNNLITEIPPAHPSTPPESKPVESTDFASLGVSDDLVAALSRAGINEPWPIQALTIPDALAGRDVCGKAKTGSGKTLAFGIPLIERTERAAPHKPRALVLVPTRELALQVESVLAPLARVRNQRCLSVYGGVGFGKQRDGLQRGVETVIATPGRLLDLLQQRELTLTDVQYVVIDEADHMADIGFLPQVERILNQLGGKAQTLLFSATLDGMIGSLVRRYQDDPVHHAVVSTTETVDEMEHRFIQVREEDKVRVAAAICTGSARTLIFVRTQRGADRLARDLQRERIKAEAIHGGLNQGNRQRALKAFAEGRIAALVATNVAARGLDIDGVETVVHYDIPEDLKTYLHRSGRTARAGEAGMVVTLVLPWQAPEVRAIRRQEGVRQQIVAMDSSDPRLLDLPSWQPPQEEPAKPARSASTSRYILSGEDLRRKTGPAPAPPLRVQTRTWPQRSRRR